MSKGGSNNNSSSSSPAPEPVGKPVYPNMPTPLEFSAYSPGQQEAIVSQLNRGYGTDYDEVLGHTNQTTENMTIPRLYEPITQTQKALESGDWNMPETQSTGSFALDALLGIPAAQPAAFTPGGVAAPNVTSNSGSIIPNNNQFPTINDNWEISGGGGGK